jgi:hypothetical protein
MPMTSSRCGWPVAVERFAELLAQLPMGEVEREVGGHIGELGHAFDDFAQRRQTANVAHDQGGHHALAQLAQGALQALVAGWRGQVREKVAHLRRGNRLRGVLAKPGAISGGRRADCAGSGCAAWAVCQGESERAGIGVLSIVGFHEFSSGDLLDRACAAGTEEHSGKAVTMRLGSIVRPGIPTF